MKTGIFLLVFSMTLLGCKSRDQMMSAQRSYVTPQTVELQVHETIQDTLVVEADDRVLPEEKVSHTEGAELMQYCVIVGSFIYRQNAIHLRNDLMGQGFLGASIMRNSEGMYRVSVLCSDNLNYAQQELERIRSRYLRFRDAWLLKTKN